MEILENIDEMTHINKKDLLKIYRKLLIKAFFKGKYSDDYKSTLDYYRENYSSEVDVYNEYLKVLRKNINRKQNEEIIKMIRFLHNKYEDTLLHYSRLGELYNYDHPDLTGEIYIDIHKNQSLHDEVYGLSLSDADVERYFKNGDAMYYLKEHTKYLNAGSDTSYGIYPFIENGILRRINLVVPRVHDLYTAKVNIHEYRYGIDLYDLIGEEYPEENDFEERAQQEEQNFVEHYIRNK